MAHYNDVNLLDKAVEITKEYAKGGGSTRPGTILKEVFEMLKELNRDINLG